MHSQDTPYESLTLPAINSTPQKATEMEGKLWAKLCKDCKLMCKALTTTDVDLIFAKVKTKGARKIPFDQFKLACDAVAAKKVGRRCPTLKRMGQTCAPTLAKL
jgi:hypothetical protein